MRIALVFLVSFFAPFMLMMAEPAASTSVTGGPLTFMMSESAGKEVFDVSGFPQKAYPPCPTESKDAITGASIKLACFSAGTYSVRPKTTNEIKAHLWTEDGKEYRAVWVPIHEAYIHGEVNNCPVHVSCKAGEALIIKGADGGNGGNGPVFNDPPGATHVPGIIEGDCTNPNNNAAHCTPEWK